MYHHDPNSSRRRFLQSATLFGIGSILLPRESLRAECANETKPSRRTNSAEKSMRNLNSRKGPAIVWTSRKCTSGNMPCLNADSHPVFENPHGWTVEQMDDIYDRFLYPRAMAFNIKWMGLAEYMKEGPYTTVRARLDRQNRD